MKCVSDKCRRENQNTHFTYIQYFVSENHAFYEIMFKDISEPDMLSMKIQ